VQKKKIWETCQPDLKTSGDRWAPFERAWRRREGGGGGSGLGTGTYTPLRAPAHPVQPPLPHACRVAGFKGEPMLTSAGPVTAPTLANANIS
jgi:hypothetical protein